MRRAAAIFTVFLSVFASAALAGSVSLRSSSQPSLELRIDAGSGSVNVDAPGASVREVDDVTIVVLGDGTHRGIIDIGSGDVDLSFAAAAPAQ